MLTTATQAKAGETTREDTRPHNFSCGYLSCHLTVENIGVNIRSLGPSSTVRINLSLIAVETLDALIEKLNLFLLGAQYSPSLPQIIFTDPPIHSSTRSELISQLECLKKLQLSHMMVSLNLPNCFDFTLSRSVPTRYSPEDLLFLLEAIKEIPQVCQLDFSSSFIEEFGPETLIAVIQKISTFPKLLSLNLGDSSCWKLNELQIFSAISNLLSIPELKIFYFTPSNLFEKLSPKNMLAIAKLADSKKELTNFQLLDHSYFHPVPARRLLSAEENHDRATAELILAFKNSITFNPSRIFSPEIEASEVNLQEIFIVFLENNLEQLSVLPELLRRNRDNSTFLRKLSLERLQALATSFLNSYPERLSVVLDLYRTYPDIKEIILKHVESYLEYFHLLLERIVPGENTMLTELPRESVAVVATQFLNLHPEKIDLFLSSSQKGFSLTEVILEFLKSHPEQPILSVQRLGSYDDSCLHGLPENIAQAIVTHSLKLHPEKITAVLDALEKYAYLREVLLQFYEKNPEQVGSLSHPSFTRSLPTDPELFNHEQSRIEKIVREALKTTKDHYYILRLGQSYPALNIYKFRCEELKKLEEIDLPKGHYTSLSIDLTHYRDIEDYKEKILSLCRKKKIFIDKLDLQITIHDQNEVELESIASLVNQLRPILPISLTVKIPHFTKNAEMFFGFMRHFPKRLQCVLDLSSDSTDNVLGDIAPPQFLDLMRRLAENKHIVNISLNNHKLANLGAEVLKEGFGYFTANGSTLTKLNLKNNVLFTLGFNLINHFLTTYDDKAELVIGTPSALEESLLETQWTLAEKIQVCRFLVKSYLLKNASENALDFKNWLPSDATKALIMECFDETPEQFPKLHLLAIHNPCLGDLEPNWVRDITKKFLQEFPQRYFELSSMFTLYPLILKADNFELREMVNMAENTSWSSYGEQISLPLLSLTPENTSEIKNLLERIMRRKKYPQLSIRLENQTPDELILLASVLNEVMFPVGTILSLTEIEFSVHGMVRVTSFLNSIKNSSISGFDFSRHSLQENNQSDFLVFLQILSERPFLYINLSNNNLNIFEKEAIFAGFKVFEKSHTQEIDLSNNALYCFGLDFLKNLNECFQGNIVIRFFSPNFMRNNNDFEVFRDSLEQDEKLQLAMIYYRSLGINTMLGIGRCYTDNLYDFGLAEEKVLAIFQDIISENKILKKTGSHQVVLDNDLLARLPLKSQGFFTLIRRLITLTGRWSYHQNISLDPIHKVDLFLYATQLDHDTFSRIDSFDLFTTNDPVIEILSSWKGVYLEENEPVILAEPEEEDFEVLPDSGQTLPYHYLQHEEDLDIVASRVRKVTLPKLSELCKVYFPNAPFIQSLIKSIQTYKEDEDGSLPLINMAEWFSWACARMLIDPNIMQSLAEDAEIRNICNKVLKEILNLASPQLRYTLSSFFFDEVCLDTKKQSVSLLKSLPTDSLLPVLALCKMISQEKDVAEQEKCTQEIKDVIQKVSFGYYEGRHFRSLVTAILAVSENTNLASLARLKLIKKLLTKSEEQSFIEDQFNTLLNISKMDRVSQERLNKLEQQKKDYEKEIAPILKISAPTPNEKKNIVAARTQLEALKREIEAVHSSSVYLNSTAIEDLWAALENIVNPTLFKKVREYFPRRPLSSHDVRPITRRILEDLNIYFKKQRLSHLLTIQGLAKLDQLSKFCDLGGKSFTSQARDVLKSLFELSENQANAYDTIFSKHHNESAILTYFSKILSLKEEQSDKLIALFKEFVRRVLSNNSAEFYQQRYVKENNRHLTTVFKENTTLEHLWKLGESRDLPAFMAEHQLSLKKYKPNFREFLDKKIFKHKHLDPSFYNFLRQYLDAADDLKRKEALLSAKKLMSQQSTEQQQDKKQHAIIQYECIELLEASKIQEESYGTVLKILSRIRRALSFSNNHDNQFRHDIDGMMKGLKASQKTPRRQDWTGWKVRNTDHYWSLFMAGTDVEGSCQAVDGIPSLNKCLMAYVMNGQNRMLAIQNADDITKARCILRILWDAQNETPVLFLEEIYPETIRQDLHDALVKLAIIHAGKLNLPLLTLESTDDSYQYEGSIEALGNDFVPWEYVDAIYAAQEESKFTIPKAQVLFQPTLKNDLAARANNALQELLESQNEVDSLGEHEDALVSPLTFSQTRPAVEAEDATLTLKGTMRTTV